MRDRLPFTASRANFNASAWTQDPKSFTSLALFGSILTSRPFCARTNLFLSPLKCLKRFWSLFATAGRWFPRTTYESRLARLVFRSQLELRPQLVSPALSWVRTRWSLDSVFLENPV